MRRIYLFLFPRDESQIIYDRGGRNWRYHERRTKNLSSFIHLETNLERSLLMANKIFHRKTFVFACSAQLTLCSNLVFSLHFLSLPDSWNERTTVAQLPSFTSPTLGSEPRKSQAHRGRRLQRLSQNLLLTVHEFTMVLGMLSSRSSTSFTVSVVHCT